MSLNADMRIEGGRIPEANVQAPLSPSSPQSKVSVSQAIHVKEGALPVISQVERISYDVPAIGEQGGRPSPLGLPRDHVPEPAKPESPAVPADPNPDMSDEELEAMLAAEEAGLSESVAANASDKSKITEAAQDKMEAGQDKMQAVQIKGQETQKKAEGAITETVGELQKAHAVETIHDMGSHLDKLYENIYAFNPASRTIVQLQKSTDLDGVEHQRSLAANKQLIFCGPNGKLKAQSKEIQETLKPLIGQTFNYRKADGTTGQRTISEIELMTEEEQAEFEITFSRILTLSTFLITNKTSQKEQDKDKKVEEKSNTTATVPLRTPSRAKQTKTSDDTSFIKESISRDQFNIEKRIVDAEQQRYVRFYETQHQKNAARIKKGKKIEKEDIEKATIQQGEKTFDMLKTEQRQATRHHAFKLDTHINGASIK